MKTITIIFALLLAANAYSTPVDSIAAPMRPKLEAEQMRAEEERKFNRRNTTQPNIRFIHITLFVVTSFVIWYEAHDEWRK